MDETMTRTAVTEDRKTWKYIVFEILTCGIYQLYTLHTISNDVNMICDDDGQHTANIFVYHLAA